MLQVSYRHESAAGTLGLGGTRLIIHHAPDTETKVGKLVKRFGKNAQILLNLSEELPKYISEHYPRFDTSKLSFTTWGKHRARNTWKEYQNVVAAGILHLPPSVSEAQLRVSQRLVPGDGDPSETDLADFILGEHADDLLQGFGRICIRGVDPDDHSACPAARALLITTPDKKIAQNIPLWFHGAPPVRPVVLMPEYARGSAGDAILYVEKWVEHRTPGAIIKKSTIYSALGMTSTDFANKVERNSTWNAKLCEWSVVQAKKNTGSAGRQYFQLTANPAFTDDELIEERNSNAAIYGFTA